MARYLSTMTSTSRIRTLRRSFVAVAVGAALFGTGIGGFNLASATVSSGDRPVFVPVNPCRLTDTRPSQAVGPRATPLGADETLTVTARGSNGECTGASAIPVDAVALSLNVTATNPTANTFLTLWGDGDDPGTSNLNPGPGQRPAPNAVVTPISGNGTFNVRNNLGSVNVIIDVNGYYVPHDHDDRYARIEALDDYATLDDLDGLASAADVPFVASGAVDMTTPSVTTLNAPAGVTAAVTSAGEGLYSLQLSGLANEIDGITQVTGVTNSIDGVRACSLDSSASTATTFTVAISCYGRDGNPSTDVVLRDASFHFVITG